MMRIEWVALAMLVLGACARGPAEIIEEIPIPSSENGGAPGIGSTGEGGQGLSAGSSIIVAGAAGAIPQLTELHSGYRQALCLDCHGSVAPYPHTSSGYRPPDCVGCHGFNGAPHRDHSVPENPGCPDCHAMVAHVPKFAAPVDCVSCHYQK